MAIKPVGGKYKGVWINTLKNGENKIFVMVDSTERNDFPPHGHVVDYLTYGGIYREVSIEEHEQNYVENAFVEATPFSIPARVKIV